jgi:type VI secretion system secreted protein VgrG
VVHGSQTAVVVGPSGEEIYTDKYGRVKVQFHWDREGKKDANSSCWVRVSSAWAGKSWGAIAIPRIGQEVIVDFLEGNPDRPLITGRVYNNEQMPPYSLPDNQTQSGLKSRSSKSGSTDTFNELRFEDKKGSEEVYFHAEKDLKTVVENNEVLEVGLVKKDPGKQTVTVHGDQTITVNDGNQATTIKKGDQTVDVTLGKQTITVKGNQATTIKQGNRTVELSMGNDTLTIKMGNQTTKLNLGKSATEAMQSIELKVGQNSIKVDQMGVTIKGMMVKIEGQIQTEVKGLITKVDGTAMLMAKGGITMIN